MTSLFDAQTQKSVACTVIEAGPCFVTQLKTLEKDGYSAVQIGFGSKKEKNTSKAELGHLKKSGVAQPLRLLREFDLDPRKYNVGEQLDVNVFAEGDKVEVVGTSKGKGFAGVVKRHGFAGVGGQTHGQHNRLRAPGSMGACSFPSRVFKGKRLGGRMGNDRVKITGLKVVKIMAEHNLLVVSGSVPGAIGSFVLIQN